METRYIFIFYNFRHHYLTVFAFLIRESLTKNNLTTNLILFNYHCVKFIYYVSTGSFKIIINVTNQTRKSPFGISIQKLPRANLKVCYILSDVVYLNIDKVALSVIDSTFAVCLLLP